MFPLYKDVLQVIIRYFTLSELNSSLQVSKQWLDAVKTSKSTGVTTLCKHMHKIHHNSALTHHIAHCAYLDNAVCDIPSLFPQIATLFPNLTCLIFRCSQVPAQALLEADGLVLPPLVKMCQVTVGVDHVHRLLPAISCLSHLEFLEIDIQLTAQLSPNNVDFSGLRLNALPALQRLRFQFNATLLNGDTLFDPSFVRVLRESTSITELDFNSLHSGELLAPTIRQLVDETISPCPLIRSAKLKNVRLSNAVFERTLLHELVKIPTLTALLPLNWLTSEADMQQLSLLPHLTQLDLKSDLSIVGSLTTAGMIIACKSCPQLMALQVDHFELTTEEFDTCLDSLPQLTALKISRCHSLKRLTPILKHGLPLRMKALSIINCQFPQEDVQCVFQLQHLRQLTLAMAFNGKMPEETHARFDRKSSTCAFPDLTYSYVIRGYG